MHPGKPRIDPRVDFVAGDLGDQTAISAALDGVDVVSHQGAKVGLGVSFADAPHYVHTNSYGTAVLLAAMERAGIHRLVLASSMVIYGEGAYTDPDTGQAVRPRPRTTEDLRLGMFDPRHPVTGNVLIPSLLTEDAVPDPPNIYAASKLNQEHLASIWTRMTGSAAVALRYHNVYGPEMPKDTPYAGVASIFRSAIARGDAPRVFEDGAQRRSFIHVRDVAAANLAAIRFVLNQPTPLFRAYNVGSAEIRTIGDIAYALSKHSGGPPPVITGESRLGDVRHITASSERIKKELGWTPTMGFDHGMAEFAAAPLRGTP
ncbi:NAD-dependent epimerase/dehydratase family protein [Arthrobacter sp. NA-172]|uniref:NAD-dependent epimerase/dehydratase family protein n=1 Tax=Arthrobacter sp. NA-172 TaxID=3367524 RepID=UPI003754E492